MRFTPPPPNPVLRNALIDTRPVDAGLQNIGNALAERRREDENRRRYDEQMEFRQGNALAQRKYQQDRLDLERQRMGQSGGQGRVMNVGGNLVRVGPDGKPEVLFSPPKSDIDRRLKEAQLKKIEQGDPLKQLKARVLQQLLGPGQQQAPVQAEPQVQLQSGEVTTTDPNLIQAQTAQQEPAAPQQSDALANLTPEQRKAMALNLVSPGLGNPILQAQKGEQFGKPTTNAIERKIFDSEEGYARLKTLQAEFDPKYLTVAGNAKGAWFNFVDKLNSGSLKLNPDQQQFLEKYASYKANAWDNANRYIKEITGAQMSEAEAARLLRALPNPGTGILDGDGPTSFKSKLDNAVATLTLARMRYHFMRSGGWNGTQMSPEDIARVMKGRKTPIALPKMRSIFNNRVKELQKSGMQRPQAIGQAKQEFGI